MNTEYESLYDTNSPGIDLDEFREMVAVNAYYRAEKRSFDPIHEMDDWLEAERRVKADLGL